MKRLVTFMILLLGVYFPVFLQASQACDQQNTGFLVFGDFGMGNQTQKKVAKAMEVFCQRELCEFALLLGDNIYPDGVESAEDPQWKKKFEEPYRFLDFNFYPALGNHDYRGSIEAQIEYSNINPNWKMPARYYSFKKCHVEFFVIDTEDFDLEQSDWLRSKIEKSKATWKIVYGHRPIFSHGGHGNSKMLQNKLLPILKNRADFYLAGHDHHLEYLTKGYFPEFIVSGSAAESRPVHSGKSTLFADSIPGFVHFQMSPKNADIRFIDQNSGLIFELSKSKPRKKETH